MDIDAKKIGKFIKDFGFEFNALFINYDSTMTLGIDIYFNSYYIDSEKLKTASLELVDKLGVFISVRPHLSSINCIPKEFNLKNRRELKIRTDNGDKNE